MGYRLVMPREISQAIGGFGLGHGALVRLLSGLRHELENNAANHRQNRDPLRADLYFILSLVVWDQGRPRRFRFIVDDARATDHLYVDEVSEV